MKLETEINLAAAEAFGSKYDEACGELFQNKEIIAPILKEVVPEYKDSTIEEIIRYIDADSITSMPVDDVSVRAEQLTTEMKSVSDKLIRYDTHFKVVNPLLSSEEICVHMHIDIEVQNDYALPYPVIKRGIYYAAREISCQLGILTNVTDYNEIQKVYSIWICNERIPQKLQNTVSMYSIKKSDMIGSTEEPEEDFDLLNVIIIRRGKQTDIPIFEYLSGIFQGDKETIMKYVDLKNNEAVWKGVEHMTGLGESIARKNLEQGIQLNRRHSIERLMKNLGMSPEEAMRVLEIPLEEQKEYLEMIQH